MLTTHAFDSPLAPIIATSATVSIALLALFNFHNNGLAQRTPSVAAAMPIGVRPQTYLPISPDAARPINAATPLVDVGPPARPFIIGDDNPAFQPAVECLTRAIYYEAASESDAGKAAVAQVVLNRVRHPAFPTSVCGVVNQGSTLKTGCQFTFTCDGSLARVPLRAYWSRSRQIAIAALKGSVSPSVGLSTHYHADTVVPYWSSSLDKVAVIGAHIFYRWKGGWGTPASFTRRYSAVENDVLAIAPTLVPTQAIELQDLVDQNAKFERLRDNKNGPDYGSSSPAVNRQLLTADVESGELNVELSAKPVLRADVEAPLRLTHILN